MLAEHENRQFAHIHPNNTFIFANTGHSTYHVNGWQCVRDICEQAKVLRSITATDVSHYVATHYTSLDVPQEKGIIYLKTLRTFEIHQRKCLSMSISSQRNEGCWKIPKTVLDSHEGI